MKVLFALVALSSLAFAASAAAFQDYATAGASLERAESLAPVDRYLAADSAISFVALALAGAALLAVDAARRSRRARVVFAPAKAPAWRERVMNDLEGELSAYARQLRQAA